MISSTTTLRLSRLRPYSFEIASATSLEVTEPKSFPFAPALAESFTVLPSILAAFAFAKLKLEKLNKKQETTYKGIIENFLLLNKWNAIVISAKSKDSIDVYVRSDAVESLFVDNKVEAEITKVVKGTITNNLDGSFTFVPHKTDKNGDPIEFDLALVTNGAQVKLYK